MKRVEMKKILIPVGVIGLLLVIGGTALLLRCLTVIVHSWPRSLTPSSVHWPRSPVISAQSAEEPDAVIVSLTPSSVHRRRSTIPAPTSMNLSMWCPRPPTKRWRRPQRCGSQGTTSTCCGPSETGRTTPYCSSRSGYTRTVRCTCGTPRMTRTSSATGRSQVRASRGARRSRVLTCLPLRLTAAPARGARTAVRITRSTRYCPMKRAA